MRLIKTMVLASCIGPSHAYVHVVEFGGEVSVCGLKIKMEI